MSAAAAAMTTPQPTVLCSGGLEQRRIEGALRSRVRYRYVQPQVLVEGEGWRVVSPCCSRRVDPDGGIIDIALLEPLGGLRWRLYARDHTASRWRAVEEGVLSRLLEHLSCDPLHRFWI